MRILVDLDCVLADFVAGAAAAWGLTIKDLMEEWPAGTYGMHVPTGRALLRLRGAACPPACPPGCVVCALAGRDPPGTMTEAEWWSRINGTAEFWEHLEPLPWALDLIALVRSLTDDWWVVTAPSRCVHSLAGKQRWCREFFGVSHFDQLVPTPYKHLLAKPGVLLIDDYDANCSSFVEHGGEALTFPAHHNRLHRHKGDPMAFIRSTLGSMRRASPRSDGR